MIFQRFANTVTRPCVRSACSHKGITARDTNKLNMETNSDTNDAAGIAMTKWTPTPIGKRIIFVHPDGLCQIIGTDAGFESLPVVGEGFVIMGRSVEFCSLFRVTHRGAYYKEPMELSNHSTDHERQK